MKFDFVIGNPPYQEENDSNGRQPPVYNKFMDEAFKVSKCVELITPARFLFNAGQTPKKWNKKMLNDEHFKVLEYEPDASKIFSNTEIKGGVAITIRDENKHYGAMKTFTAYELLNSIIKKIFIINEDNAYLNTIISPRGCYRTTELFFMDFPYASSRLGDGTGNMIASNFFEKIPESYKEEKENDDLGILSRINKNRIICYIKKKYVQPNDFINGFNVAFPKSSGSGVFGETLKGAEILKPGEGATDTFINIGSFNSLYEAQSLQKYIKTKFLRSLLGVKKVTQDNPRGVWCMIPLQNFTNSSDINWDASIKDIDKQLYKKYEFTNEEISFIETNVKEMD